MARPGSKMAAILAVALFAAIGHAPTAAAQIFQPGSQPMGDDGGVTTPIQTSETCARCHALYDPADDYEPWDGWRGAMMANAGRDPIFLAALAIAEVDNPDAPDFCVRCHSMPAWLRGRSSLPEWSEADGPRFLADDDGFPSDDYDGVACMVCHRATDDVASDPMAPYQQNAQIYFYDGPGEGAYRAGPYEYLPGGGPTHPTTLSTFLPTGGFCGQCHDIVNPVVDGQRADGTPIGRRFAIERTFSEWQNSAFSARGDTCQDCHMKLMETPTRAANDGMERDYMRRHDLVGSSSWVLRALATTVPDTDGDWKAALMRSADKAEAFLTEAAELAVSDVSLDAEMAHATVRVTNLTGHKLPTGYPEGRRMWLEVAVIDGTGEAVSGSGLYDEATAELTRDAQLRTYEVELAEGGMQSFHFILNDTVMLDNRIPPEGFDPPEDRDMAPVGRDYGDGSGGYHHWDEATFDLMACGEGDLSLRVRLLFQSTTREYIEFLRDNAPDSLDPDVGNRGEMAYQLWDEHGGRTPTVMAESSMPLGASPGACPEPMPDAGPDAGVDSGIDSEVVDSGTIPPPDDSGCGCTTPASGRGAGVPLFATAFLLLVWHRRRSAKRR